jgi:hypothetical protein
VGETNPPSNVPIVNIRAPDPYAVEGSPMHDPNTTSNPGTNTALFAIVRSGPTNSELTVFYSIGGTASNGVDYLPIADRVTIMAGRRVARFLITPIDDELVEKFESVILTLQSPSSSSNTTLPYVIGRPKRAAAVIADNDGPRPICHRLSDGVFHLCLPRTNGHCFSVHGSIDLSTWDGICTNVVVDGAIHYVDPDAAELPHRFYRVAPEAQPPGDLNE